MSFLIQQSLFPGLIPEEFRSYFDGNLYDHPRITKEVSRQFFDLYAKRLPDIPLSRTVRLVLGSLKDRYSLSIIPSNSEKILRNYFIKQGIPQLFDPILGLESHATKVEKFSLLMKRFHLSQSDCLFITDTLGDILEAHKAGILAIAIDSGFHERMRLEQGKPFIIISSLDELPKVLMTIP